MTSWKASAISISLGVGLTCLDIKPTHTFLWVFYSLLLDFFFSWTCQFKQKFLEIKHLGSSLEISLPLCLPCLFFWLFGRLQRLSVKFLLLQEAIFRLARCFLVHRSECTESGAKSSLRAKLSLCPENTTNPIHCFWDPERVPKIKTN